MSRISHTLCYSSSFVPSQYVWLTGSSWPKSYFSY